LEYVGRGSKLPDEIIIADDGSIEKCNWVVDNWSSNLPLNYVWQKDKGFRKCRILNKCVSQVNSEYIIFLDGDCLPHKHFVQDHLKLAEPGYFVQGRRCFIPQKEVCDIVNHQKSLNKLIMTGKISGYFKSLRFPRPIIFKNRDQRGLIGCNWSVWKQDLKRINGFDEDYEGWGIGEDSDVCSRLYNLGIYRKFVYGRAVVYHLNHPESCKDHLNSSKNRLNDTIVSGKTKCSNGLIKTSKV